MPIAYLNLSMYTCMMGNPLKIIMICEYLILPIHPPLWHALATGKCTIWLLNIAINIVFCFSNDLPVNNGDSPDFGQPPLGNGSIFHKNMGSSLSTADQ